MHARRTTLALAICGVLTFCLAPSGASAQSGAALGAATDQQKADASKAFEEAMGHFEARRFEEALNGFRGSHGIVASPNSRLMIARSLAELGRHVEAYDDAIAAAEGADGMADPKYADTAKAARAEAATFRAKVALVTIHVEGAPEGARVTVGGRDIDRARWGKPIATLPGEVKVTLIAPAGTETRSATVAAGAATTMAIAPPRPKAAAPATQPSTAETSTGGFRPFGGGSDQRLVAYAAAGVGAVGTIGFVVFGAMHSAKFSKLEDECVDGRCAPELEDDADAGRTYQTLANVGLVVGIVGLGAGAALFLTSSPDRDRSAASRTPVVALGPGSLRVAGRF